MDAYLHDMVILKVSMNDYQSRDTKDARKLNISCSLAWNILFLGLNLHQLSILVA